MIEINKRFPPVGNDGNYLLALLQNRGMSEFRQSIDEADDLLRTIRSVNRMSRGNDATPTLAGSRTRATMQVDTLESRIPFGT